MSVEVQVEKRQFVMHKKLLMDVIKRQAGTLQKAILEAVMNAIDARATRVDISVTANKVMISDNGRGFTSRQEIESWFETFGQPHEESENKIYGTFRMGRGQLMSFGKNNWRTGVFEMDVDVDKNGLEYDLRDNLEPYPGCRIEIELYQKLNVSEIRQTTDEVKSATKYAPIEIYIDGTLINHRDVKWDLETDDAYFKFTAGGDLKVYNLGILTRSYYSGTFGCGGIAVSKRQLKLNFARNDIQSDCPVWKRMKARINEFADGEIRKKKKPLTPAERHRLATQLRDGELDANEAYKLPIFQDVSGKWWSIEKMQAQVYRYRDVITAAPLNSSKGDRLMQLNLALVLNETNFDEHFGVNSIADLVEKVLKPVCDKCSSASSWAFKTRTLSSLTRDLHESYELIPEKEWTDIEKAIIETICSAESRIRKGVSPEPPHRRMLIGQSGTANGWTDGETYVAFSRDYVRDVGTNVDGWVALGGLLAHEYCHSDPSSETHNHTPDFYELYHRLTRECLGEFVAYCISRFGTNLERHNRRLTKEHLRQQAFRDRMAEKAAQLSTLSSAVKPLT